jgi:hypothetical protein
MLTFYTGLMKCDSSVLSKRNAVTSEQYACKFNTLNRSVSHPQRNVFNSLPPPAPLTILTENLHVALEENNANPVKVPEQYSIQRGRVFNLRTADVYFSLTHFREMLCYPNTK